jgi:hypothetical protein
MDWVRLCNQAEMISGLPDIQSIRMLTSSPDAWFSMQKVGPKK